MNSVFMEKNITRNSLIVYINSIFILLFSQVFAQTVSIDGKVTSNRWPMKQVLVTFIDEVDTTKKFSSATDDAGYFKIDVPTSVGNGNINPPADFELAQNYPNPFSSSTAIPYRVKRQSDISVTIYDILGREVREFTIGMQSAGLHRITWDGRNRIGERAANGIYLYKLRSGDKSLVKKMILTSGANNLIPLKQTDFPKISESNHNLGKISSGVNYTVRLENTESSMPVILSKQFENVHIQNDTTMNFSVDYLPTTTVNLDSVYQVIRGFGASNILLWRPDMTDSEIQRAFGTGEGQLGFTILRIMVEALKSRWNAYLSTAKKAYDLGATIIASPWYAPGEMVETVNGVSRVRHDMYDEYAAHLDSFSTYMAENGVPVYGLSVQNEPDITDQWTSWTSEEIFTFMKDYAHVIEGTKVMAPESFHFDRDYSDPILNDSAACANTDIICGHIYGSGLGKYPLAEEKGKEVWMSEYLINSPDSGPNMDTSWTAALQTGKTINDCMESNMNAYVWWYIVRYYGPMCDGAYLRKGEITKKGYVMSQFARFVRPGDHRVYSYVYPIMENIYVTAYKDSLSSKTVMIALNMNASKKETAFKIQNNTVSTFIPYTSSASKDVVQGDVINLTGNEFTFSLEAKSITTFVSE